MRDKPSNKSKQGIETLDKLRSICLPLQQVEEIVDGFGHTTFKVSGKSFIILGEDEKNRSLSFKADKETQELLLQQGKFFKTPYIGRHGWVSLQTNDINWNELEDLIKEAYLRTAPKRLVKQYLDSRKVEHD